jgi:8-oxo-dGTP pyrophosphatase MutT (NUDIX family)
MTAPLKRIWPKAFNDAGKSDLRSQFAALCYRRKNGKIQVLLITTRETGRWIIPKGWPDMQYTPGDLALREAWEEAGVKGKVSDAPIGLFSYMKSYDDKDALPCMATVYVVEVKSLDDDYPEVGQRKRKWFSRKKAAQMVSEPELARIIREFKP